MRRPGVSRTSVRLKIDLDLEDPGVQLLGLPGARSRCGHGRALLLRRTIRIQRYSMQQTAKLQQDRKDDPLDRARGQNRPRNEIRISAA
jgi:hypothetical protein